ncbi:unnamed protein product [Vitrella brassicaformis CCMP3155]|uniref:Uncharacterized protein n=1 Tax=Vitrella brassicaformis (strain CCMP3155) TaxID=1169540 RepID=A0A0G4EYB7_VITBC|nr:unnamed protein product [Vitrella brassicaformis CCMP3155]|eukprot:CEM03440.1 unnamed protein product [Vitrella brassicaformis CCMP3155]
MGNVEDDTQLVSTSVSGSTVSVTTGVAKSLGDDSTFANRFIKYGPTVRAPIEHVRRIVDVVSRAHMKGAAITAADVRGAMGDLAINGYRHALTMYGLDSDRYLGPADGLLTTEHLHKMRQWCEGEEDAPAHIPSCVGDPVMRIYKATVDGWKWLDFFEAVNGRSPLLLISKVADSNELFAIIIEGPIEVTGTAKSRSDTKSYAFKLQGTDSHPHVGYIGWNNKMSIAGTQDRVTPLIDFISPASYATAVLAAASFYFGVRPAAQMGQIGAPAAASDEIMKRCQGVVLEEEQADEWRQWHRPSVRLSDYGGDTDAVLLPVSVKGWHFDISELEAYKLA